MRPQRSATSSSMIHSDHWDAVNSLCQVSSVPNLTMFLKYLHAFYFERLKLLPESALRSAICLTLSFHLLCEHHARGARCRNASVRAERIVPNRKTIRVSGHFKIKQHVLWCLSNYITTRVTGPKVISRSDPEEIWRHGPGKVKLELGTRPFNEETNRRREAHGVHVNCG